MKKRNRILLGGLCFLVLGSGILLYNKKIDAGQDFEQTKTFAEINKENPYLKNDNLRTTKDIYAKGKHIYITNEEMEWQTEVFKLANSDNPEGVAFKFICNLKTLYYVAKEAGFLASDEELDKAIAFNIETYEQMKKDGEVDALYESYGGVQNYANEMSEVTRKNMTIEKYMKSLKDEYAKEFTEEQISLGELEENWADKRLEIEHSLVEQENIQKQ